MQQAQLNIKKWGNSLGVRMPSAIANAVNFKENQVVNLTVDGDCVIISKTNDDKFMSLEDRLAKFSAKNHSVEVMQTSELLGSENW